MRSARSFFLPILLSLIALGQAPSVRAADPSAQTDKSSPRVQDAVVSVVLANGLGAWRGTGFCIGDGSWVVTCRHVVALEMGNGKRLMVPHVKVLSPWMGESMSADVV